MSDTFSTTENSLFGFSEGSGSHSAALTSKMADEATNQFSVSTLECTKILPEN